MLDEKPCDPSRFTVGDNTVGIRHPSTRMGAEEDASDGRRHLILGRSQDPASQVSVGDVFKPANREAAIWEEVSFNYPSVVAADPSHREI